MSEQDFASGTAYNALAPTLADTPVIPWADLAVTNPPESPLPIGLQVVPTLAALTAQGQSNPVLLQADAQRRLLTAADSDLTGNTSAAVNVGDSTITLYSATGFIIGRSILYIPLNGGVLNPTQVERHTVTAISGSTLTIGDSFLHAGGIGSIVVEIPDVQTPPNGRVLAFGNTANGFKNVQVPITERIVALGFLMGPYGDLNSVSCSGGQSGMTYQPISTSSQPGLYIFPVQGTADTFVTFGISAISQFDTYTIIGYETVPAIFQERRGRRFGDSGISTSFPLTNVIAFRQWSPGFAFGTVITDVIATLRNGGGTGVRTLLNWTPNLTFPASFTSIGELAITATAGDIDRFELHDINLAVDIVNGSQIGFDIAPGASNFESLIIATAVD